jgi:hypothetical protein
MTIPKSVRDSLLVEARHRCTICGEKCFEIHHIIEQAQGGPDEPENLIVLCPNCHQQRYHRSGEFTQDQLRIYKAKLKEKQEVEKRLLRSLEDIRLSLSSADPGEVERTLRAELVESASLVTSESSPGIHSEIQRTSEWLAERDLMRGGARRAIEIEWDIQKEREKRKFPDISIVRVIDEAFRKAPDFASAYYLEFLLTQSPRSQWAEAFEQNYHYSFYNMKRKTEVEGNRIVMVVAESDNLQAHADFAKKLVSQTNDFIRSQLFSHIDTQCELRKQEALRQFDAIKSLRDRAKGIRI